MAGALASIMIGACAGVPEVTYAPTGPGGSAQPRLCTPTCAEGQRCTDAGCIADPARVEGAERRRRHANNAMIAGGSIGVIGVILLGFGLAELMRQADDPDNDGLSGGVLAITGGVVTGGGLLTLLGGGIAHSGSRTGPPARPTVRVLPALGAGARGGHAGLALDVRF